MYTLRDPMPSSRMGELTLSFTFPVNLVSKFGSLVLSKKRHQSVIPLLLSLTHHICNLFLRIHTYFCKFINCYFNYFRTCIFSHNVFLSCLRCLSFRILPSPVDDKTIALLNNKGLTLWTHSEAEYTVWFHSLISLI